MVMVISRADSLFIRQAGKNWDLYNLPEGFVIRGCLDLSGKGLKNLPDLSNVIVDGLFDCSDNELTSLKGAPQEVGGDFYCDDYICDKYNLGKIFTLKELKTSEVFVKETNQAKIDENLNSNNLAQEQQIKEYYETKEKSAQSVSRIKSHKESVKGVVTSTIKSALHASTSPTSTKLNGRGGGGRDDR